MSVFVLWEDKALSTIDRFGPHVFLVACVAVRLDLDRHRLMRTEQIEGRARAGNANVLRELGRGPLWSSGATIVAVLDTDRLHDRLPGIQARRTIAAADYERWCEAIATQVQTGIPAIAASRLKIEFLDDNLETLLSLVGRGAPELAHALQKDRLARDKILQRAAADPALVATACADMPSWKHLVVTVADQVAVEMTAAALVAEQPNE